MSFQPVLPATGLVGWRFLERTYESQTTAFSKAPEITRDTSYFETRISEIKTAEDLVSDRRLLRVALGAFGLQEDLDSKFFIKKILEDGTLKSDALANRLADDRYKNLTKAFGFGDFAIPRTQLSTFGTEITDKYRQQQFEVAVGNQDDDMRLALNARRTLPEIVAGSGSDDTKWFRIMGTPPLRQVFETALGLPSGFGRLDLDQQLDVFREKSARQFGVDSVADFDTPEFQEKLIQRFLLRAQVQQAAQNTAANVALTLLQSAPNLTP